MSDEQTLLAVLVVIYLVDCVYWVPRSGLSVTNWLSKRWTLRFPSAIVGNERGALGFANPLPPLGLASRCLGLTISIAHEGIFSRKLWRWSEIKTVERSEREILINGELFYKAPTEYAARRLAIELARLSKRDDKKRAVEITKLISDSCDPDLITNRIDTFKKTTARLRLLANILFAFLFIICPFSVWRFGIVAALWPIVGAMYLQTIVISLLFSKAHRKIYPDDSAQILKPFITMLLAAPSAIRVQDILCRPLLEPFHPLAVAKALCPPDQFTPLASQTIRDLTYPRQKLNTVESAHRDTLLKTITTQLELDPADFLQPPKPTESTHTKYCPRCLQQFTQHAASCPDCGERELNRF